MTLQVLSGLTIQVWKQTSMCEDGMPACAGCQSEALADFAEWAWTHGWAIQRVDRSGGESRPIAEALTFTRPPDTEGDKG